MNAAHFTVELDVCVTQNVSRLQLWLECECGYTKIYMKVSNLVDAPLLRTATQKKIYSKQSF